MVVPARARCESGQNRPGCATMPLVDEDWEAEDVAAIEDQRREMLRGLGQVIEQAAFMEYELRVLFCALLNTPFATVVAARQNASWLIDNARALIKANVITGDLTEDNAARLGRHLASCQAASVSRNKLVHGMLAQDGATFMQAEAARGSHELSWATRTPDEVQTVALRLGGAATGLLEAIQQCLGQRRTKLEAELRNMPSLPLDDDPPAD